MKLFMKWLMNWVLDLAILFYATICCKGAVDTFSIDNKIGCLYFSGVAVLLIIFYVGRFKDAIRS